MGRRDKRSCSLVLFQGAMAGLADFHPHPLGQIRRDAEARTKDLQDQRITHADQLHAPPQTDTQRLEPLRVLVIGIDLPHHGADARRQFVKPHGGGRLYDGCHTDNKIGLMPRKSIIRHDRLDTAQSG